MLCTCLVIYKNLTISSDLSLPPLSSLSIQQPPPNQHRSYNTRSSSSNTSQPFSPPQPLSNISPPPGQQYGQQTFSNPPPSGFQPQDIPAPVPTRAPVAPMSPPVMPAMWTPDMPIKFGGTVGTQPTQQQATGPWDPNKGFKFG